MVKRERDALKAMIAKRTRNVRVMVPESWNPDIGTLEWFAHCAQLAIDKIFFGGSNSFVEI